MRLLRLRSDGGAAASVMANGKGRRATTAAERMLHRRSLQRLLAISWPMRSFASSSRVASPRDLLHACARLTPRANLSFASKVLRTTTTTIGECCSELATEVASQSERNTYVRFILAAISTMEIGGDESSVQLAILL
ncbi:hypothetical protein EJB05_43373, partial [Eragrostis curvula]